MSDIKNIKSLDAKIKALQTEENIQIQALRSQKDSIVHNLSPTVLLRSAVNTLSIKPGKYRTSTIDIVTGLLAGFIGKKVWAGKSSGWFKKLTAPIIQYFVTIFVKNKIKKIRTPKYIQNAQDEV